MILEIIKTLGIVVIGIGIIKMAFYPKVIDYPTQDGEEYDEMPDMSDVTNYDRFLQEFPDAKAILQYPTKASKPVMIATDEPVQFGEVPIYPDTFDDSVEIITDDDEYEKEIKSKYGRR